MWEFRHTVECRVGREFAWRFWTDVSNWAAVDVSVESVELEGAFAAGGVGVTRPRGGDPVEWRLAEVSETSRAVIEVGAPGATLRFVWSFEDAGEGSTRLTQQVVFEGGRAEEYAQAFGEELRAGVPKGMQSLCAAMAARAKNSPGGEG